MKKTALLALALLAGFAPSAVVAQVVAAAPKTAAKPRETCPCSDYRFVPVTEKAKAVVAYWDARRGVKSAGLVGTFALFGAMLSGRPTNSLNDAADALGQAKAKMAAARERAEKLGGLKVTGTGDDAVATITLLLGTDYTLDGR
jgi:hypothetical protein